MDDKDRTNGPGGRPGTTEGTKTDDGDRMDVVEGPVGLASLKEPADVAASAADRTAPPSIEEDHAAGSSDRT